MKMRDRLLSVLNCTALFASAFFGFTPSAVAQSALADVHHLKLPGNAPLHAVAKDGDATYFGTDKGILWQMMHHEPDEADSVWNKGQVDAMIVWQGLLIFGSGNTLYAGPVDEPQQWAAVPAASFKGGLPQGNWSGLIACGEGLLGVAGGSFYISQNGTQWEPLLADGNAPLAAGCYRALWVVARFPDGACRIGRSEDGKNWTWGEALPQDFVPNAGVFPVFYDRLGVLGGTVGTGSGARQPAILALQFDDAGRQGAELFVWGGTGGLPIQVWASLEGLWARLPDGTVASGYEGKHWTLFAKPSLGKVHSKVVGNPRFQGFSYLSGYKNGYTIISDYQLSQIEDAVPVAWKETVTVEPKVEFIAAKPNLPVIDPLPTGLPVTARNRLVQDGTRLFASAADREAGIWAGDPGGQFRRFALDGQDVGDIAAAGGELLAMVGYGKEVVVIDPQSGEVKRRYPSGGGGFSWLDTIDGEFFAVIRDAHGGGYTLMRRLPGESEWRYFPLPAYIRGLAKTGGRYYGSASPQGILSSDNCIDWQYAPLEGDFTGITAIAAAGNRLFRIERESDYDKNTTALTLMMTADGKNWEMLAPLVLPERHSGFRGALHDGKRYWILYDAGAFVSDDPEAKVWKQVRQPNAGGRSPLWPLPDGRVALAQGRSLTAFDVQGTSQVSHPLEVAVRTMQGGEATPAQPDVIEAVRVAHEGRQAVIKAEREKTQQAQVAKKQAATWVRDGAIAYDKKDYAKAVRLWEQAAEAGDLDAMLLLSEMNLDDSKTDAAYVASVGWTQKALATGDPKAKASAGLWSDYLIARATKQYVANQKGDPARVRFFLDLEMKLDAATDKIYSMPSMPYAIAHFYAGNLQSEADLQRLIFWGKKTLSGKEERFKDGVREIAEDMLANGRRHFNAGRQQLALWNWQGAAELGNAEAMLFVALVYLNPVEVEEDIDRALLWTQKAAALGMAGAQEQLLQIREKEPTLRAQTAKAQKRTTPLVARLEQLKKVEEGTATQTAATGRTASVQQAIDAGVSAYRDGDISSIIFNWIIAATGKDAQAEFFLGTYYLTDIGDGDAMENLDFGLKNLEASVAQGYAPAIAVHAELKPLLDGVRQEISAKSGAKPVKGENWLKMEAMMKRHLDKDIAAYGTVAVTEQAQERAAIKQMQAEQLLKKGVELFDAGQFAAAISNWESAAARGNGQAMFLIANMYMNGLATGKQEMEKAVEWLQKAVDAGFEPARQHLQDISDLVRRMKASGQLP